MTTSPDLKERLLERSGNLIGHGNRTILREAAARIEALEAENAALRETVGEPVVMAARERADRIAIDQFLTNHEPAKKYVRTLISLVIIAAETAAGDKANRLARDIEADRDRLTAQVKALREAVRAVVNATSAYLPPDGISASDCISRVLEATDNPEINKVMETSNGHS